MGSSLFAKCWPFLAFSVKVFKFTPDFIRAIIWSFSDNKSNLLFLGLRYLVFSSRIKGYAKNTYLGRYLVLKNLGFLSVGDNVSIHDFCYIDAFGEIEVGNNVSIAHNCSLISFNHSWEDLDLPIKYNPVKKAKIIIEDDVWIGCGARIIPGVKIGKRSIVAAGAVVTSHVPCGVIAA